MNMAAQVSGARSAHAELNRFLNLFDALMEANTAWMTVTPREKWEWTPFDNPNMKFGDRISTIHIRSVYVHTIVGETNWASLLPHVEDGADMVFDMSRIKGLTAQLDASEDLIADAMKLHRSNMGAFAALSDAQLAKNLRWMGREWTVMGFLWGIYSHRSYHLGNIDILMREADEDAPDFFANFRQKLA